MGYTGMAKREPANCHAFTNALKMIFFTILLGAFSGTVIWCFLKLISLCSDFLWHTVPEKAGTRLLMIPVCAVGGAIVGLMHRSFGDYPEELDTVMGKIKKEKYYSYHPMSVMLLCAFLPLVLGASVGPEAGLTGIIAALCFWVGDNVNLAKQNAAWFSEIGEAVTLGQLFHAPLFGILAVEEPRQTDSSMGEREPSGEKGTISIAGPLTKPMKLFFYGLSTASGFLTARGLTLLFGEAMEGFPSFSEAEIHTVDFALLPVYILVGFLLYLIFEKADRLSEKAAEHVPVIARETVCGVLIALMGLFIPIALFSGEEQMAELMKDYGVYSAGFLIGVCIVKLILTAFCIRFGLKGGHFFPIIFACVCMGYGISMLLFADPSEHLAFAAAIVTASTLGAQVKKPFAVSVLMLLCFPAKTLFWIFLSAVISRQLSAFISKEQAA